MSVMRGGSGVEIYALAMISKLKSCCTVEKRVLAKKHLNKVRHTCGKQCKCNSHLA